jgi:pimeloyl-ACP methyl ester carboxylesterase
MRAIFKGFRRILQLPQPVYSELVKLVEDLTNYRIEQMNFDRIAPQTQIGHALIFHDQDDKITPFHHSRSLARNWPKAELIPVKGSGHYKILWDEQVLKLVKNYLRPEEETMTR